MDGGGEAIFPMAYFCQNGDLAILKWLHANGAADDITRTDEDGWTLMLLACATNNLEICRWLFSVGAEADARRRNRCKLG